MIKKLLQFLSRDNPLHHYLHHFLIANVGLFFAYAIYGSITVWEALLFFFMIFLPMIDEFIYAVLHYLDMASCREIVHLFIGSEYETTLSRLHSYRLSFSRLVLHNLVVYCALWSLIYIFLMLNMPLAFFGLAGLLVHLMQDIANDVYEFKTLRHWLWPVQALGIAV